MAAVECAYCVLYCDRTKRLYESSPEQYDFVATHDAEPRGMGRHTFHDGRLGWHHVDVIRKPATACGPCRFENCAETCRHYVAPQLYVGQRRSFASMAETVRIPVAPSHDSESWYERSLHTDPVTVGIVDDNSVVAGRLLSSNVLANGEMEHVVMLHPRHAALIYREIKSGRPWAMGAADPESFTVHALLYAALVPTIRTSIDSLGNGVFQATSRMEWKVMYRDRAPPPADDDADDDIPDLVDTAPKSGLAKLDATEMRRRVGAMKAAAAQATTAWVDDMMSTIVGKLEDFLRQLEVRLKRDGKIGDTTNVLVIPWKGSQPAVHLRDALVARLHNEGFSVPAESAGGIVITWD